MRNLIKTVLIFLFFLQTTYRAGEYIVRQGAGGDTFFIISRGRVSKILNFIRNFNSYEYSLLMLNKWIVTNVSVSGAIS